MLLNATVNQHKRNRSSLGGLARDSRETAKRAIKTLDGSIPGNREHYKKIKNSCPFRAPNATGEIEGPAGPFPLKKQLILFPLSRKERTCMP